MLLLKIYRHSKVMFALMVFFVIMQTYYSLQFTKLLKWVDNQLPVPHPITTEMLPFVHYNMYSGKITDWNNYYCFRIYADENEVVLTDLQVILEEYFVNPTEKFLGQKPASFENPELKEHIRYILGDTPLAEKFYRNASNSGMTDTDFGNWLKRFCSKTLGKEVMQLVVVKEFYSYENGKPVFKSKEEVLNTSPF